MPNPDQDPPKTPACDYCREKKIRCGRERPQCGNCTTRKLVCVYSDRPKRENDQMRNAHLFDEVHARLDKLDVTMSRIAAALDIQHESSIGVRVQRRGTASNRTRWRDSTISMGSTDSSPDGDDLDHATYAQPDTDYSPPSNRSGRQSFVEDVEGNTFFYGAPSMLGIPAEAAAAANQASSSTAASKSPRTPNIPAADLTDLQDKVSSLLDPNAYIMLSHRPQHHKYWLPPKPAAVRILDAYFSSFVWLLPIFKREPFMTEVEAMYANPDSAVDVGWLMVFLMAVTSGVYGACHMKEDLLREYREGSERMMIMLRATRQAWELMEEVGTETLLRPRVDNVRMLLIMAASANEIARPGLCWMLLCNACSLAKSLGLHRAHVPPCSRMTSGLTASRSSGTPQQGCPPADMDPDVLDRRYLFWTLYIMDKSLCLTLGRPSSLHDHDIDVPLPPADDPRNPLSDLFLAWAQHAQIQGDIWIRLYSARAGRMGGRERKAAVRELDGQLRAWWEEWEVLLIAARAGAGKKEGEEGSVERRYLAVDLMFGWYNTLVLVHRMNTEKARTQEGERMEGDEEHDGGRFTPSESEMICREHARKSILLVMDIAKQKGNPLSESVMLMWLFSYYPFTTFFILFTTIVRAPHLHTAQSDFALLKFVVEFLNNMRDVHSGAAKLLPVVQALVRIAARYVEAVYWDEGDGVRVPAGKVVGKRKLGVEDGVDGGEGHEKEVRRGQEPVPSEDLLRRYPDQGYNQPKPSQVNIDLTLANFITWPGAGSMANLGQITPAPYTSASTTSGPIPAVSVTSPTPTTSNFAPVYPINANDDSLELMQDLSGLSEHELDPVWGGTSGTPGFSAWVTTSLPGPVLAGQGVDGTSYVDTTYVGHGGNFQSGHGHVSEADREFQDRVAMAAGEGPLEFDWFAWERWCETVDKGESLGLEGGAGLDGV